VSERRSLFLRGLALIILGCPLANSSAALASSNGSTVGLSSACAASQVREFASTNHFLYSRAETVRVRASIANISKSACTITVGGTSPAFTIFDPAGVAKWSYCDSLVRPETCPMYLRLVTLAPGRRFTSTNSWAPSADPSGSATYGVYRLAVSFSGFASTDTTFVLGVPTSTTLVETPGDSGRKVTLKRGQRLVTRFPSSSFLKWSVPQSSNSAALVRQDTASDGGATSIFLARNAGIAKISAVGTPICYPQCLAPSRLFTIDVTIARH